MITLPQKVSLKKVRTSLVKRKSSDKNEDCRDEEDEKALIMAALAGDIRSAYLVREELLLSPSIAIVETGRKIYSDYNDINRLRSVRATEIFNHKLTRSVTLLLENSANSIVNPWQYSVKRLESYGDLEMAVWAKRIKRYNENFKITMDKYFDMLNSQESETIKQLHKHKKMAVQAQEALENNNTCFIKSTMLFDRNSANWIKMEFTEGLFKEMGFNVESFIAWAKEKGIPTVADKDSSVLLGFCSAFFETVIDVFQTVTDIHEGTTTIACVDGSKKKMLIKTVSVIEPSAEGILKHFYHIMYDCNEEEMDNENSLRHQIKRKSLKFEEIKDRDEKLSPQNVD